MTSFVPRQWRTLFVHLILAGCLPPFLMAQSPTAVRYRPSNPLTIQSAGNSVYYPDDINNYGQLVGLLYYFDADYHVYFDSPDEPETRIFEQNAGPESAINNQGQVVGTHLWPERYSFVWSAGEGVRPVPELFDSTEICSATALNDVGQVVGRACVTGSFQWLAYRWDSITGEAINLGHLPGGDFTARPTAINISGAVVGTCRSESSPSIDEAFYWTAERGMQSLGRWTNGAVPWTAASINDAGRVVGFAIEPGFAAGRPFVWDADSGFTELNLFPGLEPFRGHRPVDINNFDTVVGNGLVSNGDARAFVWSAQRGMRSLQDLLDPCDTRPRELTRATGINDLGVIVAYDELGLDTSSTVVLLTPYLVGDLDADALVGLSDLSILLPNFGRSSGATYDHGDLDCDADVDLQDLATLLANFGQTLP